MNDFLTWWKAATIQERQTLAVYCSTTTETLRQEAHAYRTDGVLTLSLGRAAYLEGGTKQLEREGLPHLKKEDLCVAWKEIAEMQRLVVDTARNS